jgi:hypothetical protein
VIKQQSDRTGVEFRVRAHADISASKPFNAIATTETFGTGLGKSAIRRISDSHDKADDGLGLTGCVNREFFGLDRLTLSILPILVPKPFETRHRLGRSPINGRRPNPLDKIEDRVLGGAPVP